MKILTVLGARPQFIKAATLSRAIKNYNIQQGESKINEILLHTGQHYDDNMSSVFFDQLEIPKPNYQLNISQTSHGAMTGRMLEKIESVIIEARPDLVLVYGDTNSTLSGALAAVKLHTPLAHVESGLRSFNKSMPEEINRILTDHTANILFAPTATAVENLKNEGIPLETVYHIGDVMYDAMLHYRSRSTRPTQFPYNTDIPFFLATIHRAENTDNADILVTIVELLNRVSKIAPIVIPIHPRTRLQIGRLSNVTFADTVHVIDPVGYLEMLWLLDNCKLVLTDSGGLQKESYFYGKPCLTLRDETEWIELVNTGANVLVGNNIDIALDAALNLRFPDVNNDLYGNGTAAESILTILRGFYS